MTAVDDTALPRSAKIALVIVFIALLAFTWMFHRQVEKHELKDVEAHLAAIGKLKSDQISAWLATKKDNAATLQNHLFLPAATQLFLADPSETNRGKLMNLFRSYAKQHNYDDVVLLDPGGRARISLCGNCEAYPQIYLPYLSESFASGKPLFIDLHRRGENDPPCLATLTPLFPKNEKEKKPLGALLLVTNAAHSLYPLIDSWPLPSKTGETVLLRREGDSAVVLSNRRGQSNSALNVSYPLENDELPGVMAVLGKKGFVRVKDFRGKKITAFLQAIPESSWFIVTKMDEAEALAEWRLRSALVWALFIGLIIMLVIFFTLLSQRNRKIYYRNLYREEQELRKAEERHRITLQSIGDGVIVTDSSGRVESLNPVAETLTGWTNKEVQDRQLQDIFHILNEKNGSRVEDPVQLVLRKGAIVGLANHTLLVRRDGTRIPIADSGAPVRDSSGVIAGVVLVFRDQSEERENQRKLEENEAMFRATFEQAAVGIAHLKPDEHFLRLNKKFCDILGFSREELLGLSCHDLTLPEDIEENSQNMRRLLSNEQQSCSFEKRCLRKDKTSVWVNLTLSLARDPLGNPEYFIAVLEDISARKKNEAELERLLLAIEQSAELVVITDARGAIQHVNPAFETTTGYATREVLGKNMRIVKSGVHGPEFYHTLWKTISAGQTWHGRITNKSRDGVLFIEDTVISPVKDASGAITNYVAVKHDVTRMIELEKAYLQAQKMESVGRLAGGIAHDFNNMLSVILGSVELVLLKTAQDDPLRQKLEAILEAAERARDITRQLLAFARQQPIAPVTLDLNEAIEKTLKLIRRLIGENIELAWLPGTSLRPVRMDPAQLDQLLINLCVNARDAIGATGRIIIETQSVEFDETACASRAGFLPGRFTLVAVSDDGCGMTKGTLEKIFEPFFTTKEVGQGTGMGLATVYGIVKQNSGFINVYSEPGRGTTFKIYLPHHNEEFPKTEDTQAANTTPKTSGETVLVVEDESPVLKMAEAMLAQAGYHVLAAGDPDEAIRLAKQQAEKIQLLITDVVMPGMNGRELARRIEGICPGIKILFMSGYTAEVIAHSSIIEKGINFLQKPFTLRGLIEAARQTLNK